MLTPYVNADGGSTNQCLVWTRAVSTTKTRWSHNGSSTGARAWLATRDDGLAVAISFNASGQDVGGLFYALIQSLL